MGSLVVQQSQAEMFVIAFRAMPRETQQIILDELIGPQMKTDAVREQRARNEPALSLLHEWLTDNSGYDENTWPVVRKALEENRLSDGEIFSA